MMKVVAVPARLRVGAFLLLLAVPLAALEVIVVNRAPWWRLPLEAMTYSALVAALVFAPLMFWILDGRRWAYRATLALAVLWSVATGLAVIMLRHPALGFFTVLLLVYWILLLSLIREELGRSYFDPQLDWYHGLPKPIAGLKCEVLGKSCRVSRLDEEGAFVFCDYTPNGLDTLLKPEARNPMAFSFQGAQVSCEGELMRMLHENRGAGFRFVGLTPDKQKELGDFVERLRGQGYEH